MIKVQLTNRTLLLDIYQSIAYYLIRILMQLILVGLYSTRDGSKPLLYNNGIDI